MQRNRQERGEPSGESIPSPNGRFSLKSLFTRLVAAITSKRATVARGYVSRVYPEIPVPITNPTLPISFVVVRFSDEYLHNFLKSGCANDRLNEVIDIDNRSNLYFDNLSQAIIAGVEQARNDIIAVIHEDVLLPDGWQSQFEQSLRQLEQHDPAWGMVGSVGWDASGSFVGHWSDPHQYKNTFTDSENTFQEVEKLDEQLLIFHRHRLPGLDSNLPGIHFLGEDLKQELSRGGLRCYAIDAPTIHKYADKHGERIVSSIQSDKINDRESVTYLADEACCKDYLGWKYPNVFFPAVHATAPLPRALNSSLPVTSPIVFICKGEVEAALISKIAQAYGVAVGHEVSQPREASGLMMPVCKMIVEKYRCHAEWQKHHTQGNLQSWVARWLADLPAAAHWGIVLPESILVLPELGRVFPDARYVYFQRDPLDICLGDTPGTARLDNHIGRIALPEAYTFLGLGRARILDDNALDHMVYTTIHQLELVNQHLLKVAKSGPLTLRFEEFSNDPAATLERFSRWLGDSQSSAAIQAVGIEGPLAIQGDRYTSALISAAAERLKGIRKTLGYI